MRGHRGPRMLKHLATMLGISPEQRQAFHDRIHAAFPGHGIMGGDTIPEIVFPELIELYRQGRFPFDRMLRFYSLNDINEAVSDLENGRVLKAVVRP